ncbi:ankyrin repeat domain-containing protein [Xanthomonas hortorum]|uniref:ankyrin repeat domain-containing protein n=1 Tax=Xanthomonas hortorum TaxID=56454 RepID=UPI0015D65885|nr:ankyrin repeat domain-containing protein [Xanthomonas hortorum]MCE4342752.1 ankyrin repeat domain-containing protein [Xanthomonas hortorum pv. vitians]
MEPHINNQANLSGGDFFNRPHESLLHPILHPLTLARFYGKHHEALATADAWQALALAEKFCRENQVAGLDTSTPAGFDWVIRSNNRSGGMDLELWKGASVALIHVTDPAALEQAFNRRALQHPVLAHAYTNLLDDQRAKLLSELRESINQVQANRTAAQRLRAMRAQPELPSLSLPPLDIAGLLQRYEVPEDQAKVTEQYLIQTHGCALTTMHGSEVLAAAFQHRQHFGLFGAPWQTWLCENATLGNLAAVDACLGMGADPNCPNARGLMPIHLAARQGEGAIVRRLLEHGADPAIEGPSGTRTLDMAAGQLVAQTYVALGLARSVRSFPADVLERYGVEPGQAAELEQRLIQAHGPQLARFHEAEIAASALSFQTDLPLNVPTQRWLEEGISLNAPEVVDAAVFLGADPNQPDVMGDRPLHQAVREGNHAIVRRLLEVQADPALVNHFGQAPLHLAAQWKQARVCLELMAGGADPGQLDREGRKPGDLHRVREKGCEQTVGL